MTFIHYRMIQTNYIVFFIMHLNKYNDILEDMKDRINCSVIQCNSTENVDSNKEMIASFLNSKPCLNSDCIFLPECCLFRPQTSNSILSES